MKNIATVIGDDAASRIAAELGIEPAKITLGNDIGPSTFQGAYHRWPLFVDGAACEWLWDTAVGYELAEGPEMVDEPESHHDTDA